MKQKEINKREIVRFLRKNNIIKLIADSQQIYKDNINTLELNEIRRLMVKNYWDNQNNYPTIKFGGKRACIIYNDNYVLKFNFFNIEGITDPFLIEEKIFQKACERNLQHYFLEPIDIIKCQGTTFYVYENYPTITPIYIHILDEIEQNQKLNNFLKKYRIRDINLSNVGIKNDVIKILDYEGYIDD